MVKLAIKEEHIHPNETIIELIKHKICYSFLLISQISRRRILKCPKDKTIEQALDNIMLKL